MELPRHIFREYDIRGVVGKDLDAGSYRKLGAALGSRFLEDGAREAVIGYDNRLHSPELHAALAEGIRSTGLDLASVGLVPTPALYFALAQTERGAGAVVTASHNPPEFNGIKIVSGGAALSGEGIRQLRERAEGDLPRGEGAYVERPIIEDYLARLIGDIRPARPVRVAVDCGNGTAGLVARRLFDAWGAETEFLYEEPDGSFPNHPADPVVEENMRDLIARVREGGFEAGIGFDGDSDRIGVVDETGRLLFGDQLLALFSRALLREMPGSRIIFDVKSSRALSEDIAAHGGIPEMWKTGHSLIKQRLRETGAPLAGEMSGHVFFADRYYGYDDALYAAGRLLEILAVEEKPLSEILSDLPSYRSTPELKLPCTDEAKFDVVAALRERLAAEHEIVDLDGVRLEKPEGWGLVRASNTSPVLVLRFEATSDEALENIRGIIMKELEPLLPESR